VSKLLAFLAISDAESDREYTVVLFLGRGADEVAAESSDVLAISNYKILPL
jgi:hypothetical protein